MADPARLRQAFWNLLKNAVKFTPESGRVEVHSTERAGKTVAEVRDTGIGIAPDVMERIFLPFEQATQTRQDRRYGGLGLGLSISRAIVELHGGIIHAESDGQGEGAKFQIELPLSDTPAPRLVDNFLLARADPTGNRCNTLPVVTPLRVLLVEDHEPTIEVLRRLLTRAGHHVTAAMTVAGAVQAAQHKKFDLLISDLGLPDGTGFDLMQQLRSSYHLPGIALSGYGMNDDLRRSREAGFAAHLIKPVDFARLQEAVAEIAEN
jgi:CheY-like chemotaxis protein